MRRKLIAGLLTALSVTMVCPAAYASTEHYTDSSVVGADSGWSDWDAAWETTATDFTKVSLTEIQDKMRNACIKSYNKFYEVNTKLKEKQKGRNQDINVKETG